MALSESEIELCAKWVSAPNHKWQTLNRAQWRYIFHEKTLVRYVDVAKMDEGIVPLLLEYLTAEDGSGGYLCSSTLQLYGQGVSAEWTPVRAWYEITSKAAGSVAGVRLYHALTSEPEEQEDGPYLVEDGCAYKVSLTYYWKVAEPPTVPASTSGVSYRLSFQRDPDNGLYTATVERRERVKQDIEEYLVKTTQFEDASEEVHMGVRGDLDVGGQQASVSNGKIVTRKVTKNSDCTHDVHNTITEDKPVRDAVVEKHMTLHGLTVRRTHRNQPSPGADPENVGEGVSNQKTDSGLWNVTETEEGKEPAGLTGESCSHDAFTHRHTETRNEAEPQEVETEFTPGKIVHKTATLNSNGTANNSTDTSTAVPQVNSYTYRREDGALVHVVKYRNLPEKYSNYPDGAYGLVVSDSLNQYLLHDGSVSWATSVPYRVSIGDLKFIKHGKPVVFYEVAYNRRTRRFKHRTYTVQLHHIRGDAYTDFLSDKMDANISRTTNGIMCVKLISGPYSDKDGNLLAEWEWVSLQSPPGDGGWTYCSPSCKHQLIAVSWKQIREEARHLMGGSNGAVEEQSHQQLVDTIKELPLAMMAARSNELEIWRSRYEDLARTGGV